MSIEFNYLNYSVLWGIWHSIYIAYKIIVGWEWNGFRFDIGRNNGLLSGYWPGYEISTPLRCVIAWGAKTQIFSDGGDDGGDGIVLKNFGISEKCIEQTNNEKFKYELAWNKRFNK